MKRRGSALLIVLGMMAFMIVSAVAFSAYMRRARLPSSYLRSSGASRLLAKAALTRAIDAVDRSIANNPHPGMGQVSSGEVGSNRWRHRVLYTTNDIYRIGESVSVLTLEGLAYIPPPLVNDVRYMAQRTGTASWHQLGFDAGRYAFCAVDVSDYFDINRMAADTARSSSPGRRISLSYIFENDGHRGPGSGAQEWDQFMEKFRTPDENMLSFKYDSKVPLVSIADLNLVLGSSGIGGLWSPFCKYISGDSDSGGFYGADSESEYDRIRRMTFVTDSWFPTSNNAESDDAADGDGVVSDYDEIYDLNDPQCQPFTSQLLGGAGGPRSVNTTTILDIMSSSQKAKGRLLDSMPTMGLVALFDYLDKDHVPVSLACPTLERTPMVCGLKPNASGVEFSLKLDEDLAKKVTDEQGNVLDSKTMTTRERDAYATYEYKIDTKFATSLRGLTLQTLLAYPFAHDDAVADTTFNVEARATLFFSIDSDPVLLRTGNKDDKIHVDSKDGFGSSQKGLVSANGTIVVPFRSKSHDFGSEVISKEEDALFEMPLESMPLAGSEVSGEPVARIRYKWTQRWNDESQSYSNQTKPADATADQAHCGVRPLDSSGVPDKDFVADADFLKIITGETAGKASTTLKMALEVRISDSNGKTVDLVPAHILDDKTFNNINNNSFPDVNKVAGSAYPLMLFEMPEAKLEFSQSGLESARTAQPVKPSPEAVRVDDPRYNFAPESWYDANGDISKEEWLKECGRDKHDGDIFLATSDQGYLQSIYELAYLPRLSDLESVGGNVHRGYLEDLEDHAQGRLKSLDGARQEDAANRKLMWRTYRSFATADSATADDFEGLGFTSAGTGFKVNPYSSSTNVLMAVFANTPVDWRMASTNNSDVGVQKLRKMKAAEFNRDYAWNEYSTDSKFAWSDLEAVAGQFMLKMREYQNWKKAWRNLGWRYDPNDPDRFCGVTLSEDGERPELWGVDRKFFYGFWRDCFAAKQQLFLIFVRAEPMMMGSGYAWSATHQLGARAVALVWRDPTRTAAESSQGEEQSTGYPHRTRVLFYRQLE